MSNFIDFPTEFSSIFHLFCGSSSISAGIRCLDCSSSLRQFRSSTKRRLCRDKKNLITIFVALNGSIIHFRRAHSTITHSDSRLMRNCLIFYCRRYLLDDSRWFLAIRRKNAPMFSLSFTQVFHRLLVSSIPSDAFTFSHVRLAKKVVSFCNRNINGAGDSPLGLCLLIACES